MYGKAWKKLVTLMDLDICNTIQAAATSKENNAILGHLQAIDEEGRH